MFSIKITFINRGLNLLRNRQQRRHVLLYENHIVFCKQSGSDYHFKFSLATTTLGMSSIIKVILPKLREKSNNKKIFSCLQLETKTTCLISSERREEDGALVNRTGGYLYTRG